MGQAIHSPPAWSSAAASAGSRRSSSERFVHEDDDHVEASPARRRTHGHPRRQLAQHLVELRPGAPINPSRASGLMPSLRGSGVPE